MEKCTDFSYHLTRCGEGGGDGGSGSGDGPQTLKEASTLWLAQK